ncbi:homoserine kinase [Halobacillus fulvus]|nr:homoserine kinase [Halobacillus fulvus]
MSAFQIYVPATSANLGPGFDSIGIALTKYVTLDCEPADEWFFEVPEQDTSHIPSGKDNLIYKSAIYTANAHGYDSLPPYHVHLTNDVPIARGLGSSSTAVVGGIELANEILDLSMSKYDKLQIACDIEGHPDNVAPAIYGGIMISNYDGDNLDFVRFTKGLETLSWVAVIPSYHLETEKARDLLPTSIPYKQAVHASGTANVLVAALATQDWALAGKMMKQDQWHQPYRKQLIPGFNHVSRLFEEHGSLGLYISGAGPTMVALFNDLDHAKFKDLASKLEGYQVNNLAVDLDGVKTVCNSLTK